MKLIKTFPRAAVLGAAMVLAGFISSNATAQEISESHLAAAKKVASATKILEPFDDILPVLAEQTRTAFVQSDPTRAEEIIEVTQKVALELAPKRAELNERVYRVWAEHFTEAELNELAAFYSTELGQKLTQTIPVVTQFSVGAAREWQDKISTEMVTMVQEELKKQNEAQ
ncbi:DUF2059 domain-containing protein [Roseibium salinum]|uniref:DUF2059 domain-containing protein n=1 Tax=Roseibium salinum TaxID=1604349 RepID=A0ABT3R2N8_9HYPH|nr:DUF2059 domain-containing protein [Roseibium sp. DSM 29163]MCX2723232.1 DUF2059 domain-containing protein [Roseibium sp. DSM 29163]MDN3718852.1 DUF2059 domain-containing protein [Roseibium salinum]